MARRSRPRARKRIGRVSLYLHHGSWYVYYRQGQRPVRRRVADTESVAEGVAARINGELIHRAVRCPTTTHRSPLVN